MLTMSFSANDQSGLAFVRRASRSGRHHKATRAGNLRNTPRALTDCHFLMAISLLRGTAMKKFATAIAAIALIGTPAFAAAPSPAPAPSITGPGGMLA